MTVEVKPIKPEETYAWLLEKHYARRLCPIQYAFGLYLDGCLSGVVTYGVPASSPLRAGICGAKYKDIVLELNRLCCDNTKNKASILVGRSLRMIPPTAIIVSYADTEQGHIGYVYQATNFIYTGLSAKRTDWKIKGMEHLHGATVADMSRGMENRAQYMRDKFGDDFYLEDRSRKHRYVYFVGNKKEKREMMGSLMYATEPYPKGESRRYDSGGKVATQAVMF
jgi:hypothetical protein